MTLRLVSPVTLNCPVACSDFDLRQQYNLYTGQGNFELYIPNIFRQRTALSHYSHPPSAKHAWQCTRMFHVSSTSSHTAQYTVPVQSVLSYELPILLHLVSAPLMYVSRIHQHHTYVTPSVLLSRAAYRPLSSHTTHLQSSHNTSVPRPFLSYLLH